jgi:hypothetical protein
MFSALIRNKLSLYRRSGFRASVVALLICLGVAMASTFQRRSPHKLRATGLIEVTRDSRGKVSAVLTPITILDNGRFQDAGIYKSRPRPMALEDGIVYEAQKTGTALGYVTIDNAQVTNNIWLAEGTWQPAAQPSDKPAAAKSAPPPSGGNSSSGDDRPILHRGGSGSSQPAPPSVPPQAAPAPTPVPEPEPEPQDPDRPVLRRRKPAAEPSPATTPTPNATTAAPQTSRPAPRPTPTTVTKTPGTQVLVGVSDAEPTETRSYEFNWRPQEKEQIEAKMRKLAVDQLPGVKNQVNQPALTNVIIRSFDVDLSNDAVVVLTAEVPGGYLATETQTKTKPQPRPAQKRRAGNASRQSPPATVEENPPAKFVSRFIAVIARIDIEGNPQKLAVSVTDSSRLDVAPRLELIDAVDVDGDGLAELLFREYSFDQKSFIVYGIGHGTVTKVFEGASQPLH